MWRTSRLRFILMAPIALLALGVGLTGLGTARGAHSSPVPELRVLPNVAAPTGSVPGTRVAQANGGVQLLLPPARIPCPTSGRPAVELGVRYTAAARRRVRMVRAKFVQDNGDLKGGPIWRAHDLGRGWHLDTLNIYRACNRSSRFLYIVGLGTDQNAPSVEIERRITVTG